jgi:GNAT superfamily N-acetyltransferase
VADASVRAAVAGDAEAVADAQAAAWAQALGPVLPASVLDRLTGPDAVEAWRQAATDAPSPRHRLLVAEAGGEVVGFAALGPATDPDLDAETAAEVLALGVRPDRTREGHGSRLVNAGVDHLRDDGFATACVWVTEDDPLREFLRGAGWAEDGARRRLDLRGDGAVVVGQVRLDAAISP